MKEPGAALGGCIHLARRPSIVAVHHLSLSLSLSREAPSAPISHPVPSAPFSTVACEVRVEKKFVKSLARARARCARRAFKHSDKRVLDETAGAPRRGFHGGRSTKGGKSVTTPARERRSLLPAGARVATTKYVSHGT